MRETLHHELTVHAYHNFQAQKKSLKSTTGNVFKTVLPGFISMLAFDYSRDALLDHLAYLSPTIDRDYQVWESRKAMLDAYLKKKDIARYTSYLTLLLRYFKERVNEVKGDRKYSLYGIANSNEIAAFLLKDIDSNDPHPGVLKNLLKEAKRRLSDMKDFNKEREKGLGGDEKGQLVEEFKKAEAALN